MFDTVFTPDERIIKAKIKLTEDHPFFAYILMNMRLNKSDHIPTMAVNKYGDLYWSEKFLEKLSDPELQFVLAHETLHISTLTFDRLKSRDLKLWNIATDLVINYILHCEGFQTLNPEYNALQPDASGNYTFEDGVSINIDGKTAEEVYEELLNAGGNTGEDGEPCDGDTPRSDGGFDVHIPGGQDDQGNEQSCNDTSEAGQNANKTNWKQKIADASVKAKARGKMSSLMERLVNDIIEPEVDWRSILYNYITKELPVDFSMRRPGRKFNATGIYMPYTVRENLEVIVGVDVSGSITEKEYNKFISECYGIATSFDQIKMRIIPWAHTVDEKDDLVITTKDQLREYKTDNSGGTSLTCFTEYVERKKYNSRIYVILTDGYIENTPKVPTGNILFVLSKHGTDDIIKKYGTVCKLVNEK